MTTTIRGTAYFDVETAAPLLSGAEALADGFPTDWQSATFQVELERTPDGPRARVSAFQIDGENEHLVGHSCG
jgi:hypothetical protein